MEIDINNQSQNFYIGENLDVKDSVEKWVNAEVQELQHHRIYVHYTGWSSKYDTFISLDSNRILKQWLPGKQIQINNRIDAYHPVGGWLEARVIQLANINQPESVQKVKVHFFNFHKKYDIWVNLTDKNQVAVIGEKTNAHGIGNRKRKTKNNAKSVSQACRQLFKAKLRKMIADLKQKQLVIKDVQGDGNCLFRSISDQLYGVQTYHMQIRLLCMKYILNQKTFFQDYIIEDIEQYVYRKSQNGQWGDDLEIEAISEIYSRPIQIYAMGSKPIRTFHEENQNNVQPLKIAYIGSCHYSSIKKKNQLNIGLIRHNFGQFQELFQSTYQNNRHGQQWMARNRDKFAHSAPLQETIDQRIQAENRNQNKEVNYNQQQVMKALQQSQKEAILKQIQSAELKQFQQKSERQLMQQQLKKIQQRELQQAKKLSQKNQQKWQNPNRIQKPYWFDNLICLGYSQSQIWYAIDVKGYDPDAVQNFLLDNMMM